MSTESPAASLLVHVNSTCDLCWCYYIFIICMLLVLLNLIFRIPLQKFEHAIPLLSNGLRQQALEWKYREFVTGPVSASPEPLVNYLDVRKINTVALCLLAKGLVINPFYFNPASAVWSPNSLLSTIVGMYYCSMSIAWRSSQCHKILTSRVMRLSLSAWLSPEAVCIIQTNVALF